MRQQIDIILVILFSLLAALLFLANFFHSFRLVHYLSFLLALRLRLSLRSMANWYMHTAHTVCVCACSLYKLKTV